LDVEREARSRLRPLKRQAQAAELGARIEHEELGLRARLVAEQLRGGDFGLEAAELKAAKAREARDAIEAKLAKVSEQRREAEERFAARDRERTRSWGVLTRLRAEQERIAIQSASLTERVTELEIRVERLRAELEPLTLDVGTGAAEPDCDRRLADELTEIDAGLTAAGKGLGDARSEGPEQQRAAGLASVRSGAERATRHARRAEGLLGERRREELRARLSAQQELFGQVKATRTALEQLAGAVRGRVEAAEARLTGVGDDGDAIAEEMRACSQREYELQAEMKTASDAFTEAEVEAAHLRDRREESARELNEIAAKLGEEIEPATEPMSDEEREDIDRRLVRLERRRAQIGPVNPLAEREFEEAREHVDDLKTQREDAERAIGELAALIRDIDREIERAFEETFEATARNFEEMVEHLFPGGRGKLRRVNLRPVDDPDEEEDDDEESGERRNELGVEIEVTPAGKSTRRLSLLSGGEKSLVAIAFVFAVFLARPCPFYILDEVEAALDDANIDRFLQLVRRFSDRAQFVVVTHQKRTMDAADVLYGISMGNDGVTKVVSRRMPPQMAEEAGEQHEIGEAAEAA
ncbi:MAG: AAA family ATPase, partial [Actinomycetota bacterium]|nr:AAA family ATPase [Actinomycetota bacterium]